MVMLHAPSGAVSPVVNLYAIFVFAFVYLHMCVSYVTEICTFAHDINGYTRWHTFAVTVYCYAGYRIPDTGNMLCNNKTESNKVPL